MNILRNFANRLSIIKELLVFFWTNKLWWMIPFVVVLILIGLLLVFSQSNPIIPFLYSAF